jgi:hypothetical protein
MSWNASGYVSENDTSELLYTPPYDTLADEPRAQADFLLTMLSDCFSQGVVEGEYSLSMGGHSPTADMDTEVESTRKSLFFSLTPAPMLTPTNADTDTVE